jgi:hypothetical protein
MCLPSAWAMRKPIELHLEHLAPLRFAYRKRCLLFLRGGDAA